MARADRARRAAPLIALSLLALGCAPVGAYKGIVPVPGAPQPTGGLPGGPDSTVVLVYGDSRPGQMVLSRSYGASVVRSSLRSRNPGEWVRGLIHVPIAFLQLVFPTLDGVRDIWSTFGSKRYTGGNQLGVLRAISAEVDAELIVHTGDIVEDGRRGGQWNDFVRLYAPLRESVNFIATPGNHERTWHPEAQKNWERVMGASSGPGRLWHVVDIGRARFVLLDSNPLTDVRDRYPSDIEEALSEAELAWADSVLAAPFAYKFVVLHHPLATSGHYLEDWTMDDARGRASRRGRLIEMCHRHGVTAVLVGHEHLYERTWITDREGRRGFWHVTTGGGGSPLNRVPDERRRKALAQTLPDGSRITFPAEPEAVYHFCRMVVPGGDVSDSPPVLVRVYRVEGNHTTNMIDSFDLARTP